MKALLFITIQINYWQVWKQSDWWWYVRFSSITNGAVHKSRKVLKTIEMLIKMRLKTKEKKHEVIKRDAKIHTTLTNSTADN